MGEPAYLVIASAAPAPTNYTAPGHGLSWSSHTAVFYFPLISQEHAWQEAADLYHSKCFSSVGQLVYPSVPCSHPSGYCPHGLRQVWEHTFTKVLPWSIQDRLQLESRFKGEKPFQHFQCAICSYQQKQTAMESWCWVSICRAPLTISTPCLGWSTWSSQSWICDLCSNAGGGDTVNSPSWLQPSHTRVLVLIQNEPWCPINQGSGSAMEHSWDMTRDICLMSLKNSLPESIWTPASSLEETESAAVSLPKVFFPR